MRILRPAVFCALLLTPLLVGLLPASSVRAGDTPDLKDLVDAFRPIVPASGWSISRFEVDRGQMKEMAEKAPKEKRGSYAKGFQAARGLSFDRNGTEARVEGVVARFDSAKDAAAFVALEREIFSREKSTKDLKIDTKALTKAAGTGGTIPGFFLDRVIDFGGPTLLIQAHYIHRGPLAAWLVLTDAPQVAVDRQHEVVAYVDAFLQDPVAARRLPKPSPAATEKPSAPPKPETKPETKPDTAGKAPTSAVPKGLLGAMKAEKTPALVTWVTAGDAKAAEVAARLGKEPDLLISLAALLATDASRIASRDGDGAVALVDWLVGVAKDLRKGAEEDPRLCEALAQASLAAARVRAAAGKEVAPDCWTTAADLVIEAARCSGDQSKLGAAYMQAVALLHEGANQEGASTQRLLDHVSKLGSDGVEALPENEALRRAVAASFEQQARAASGGSKRRMQAALNAFFEVFGPLAKGKRRSMDDARKFNELVTLGRAEGLKLKAEYVTRHGAAAGALLAYDVPITGHWSTQGDHITQVFESKTVFREISFSVYDWDSVYGSDGVHDVGGDNVKGVASLHLDTKAKIFDKVRKTIKPKRGRFSKLLPSGITYTLIGLLTSGKDVRLRVFAVKAVKAEKTILITILESESLDSDPELEAVYESFDITKKKR